MSSPRKILALMTLILTFAVIHAAAVNAPTSPNELAKWLEQAVKTKNKNAALELFDWDGVSADMKAKQQAPVDMLFDAIDQGGVLTSVKVGRLPEGFQSEQVLGGIKYIPNIPVQGAIHIMLDGDNNPTEFIFVYGKKDKAFLLSALVEAKNSGKSAEKN